MIGRRAFLAGSAAFIAAALAVMPGLVGPAAAVAADPSEFIRTLGDQALAQLVGSDITKTERADRFRKLLVANFDVPAIGKTVLGRYWKAASPDEQQEYLKLFEDFLVGNYAQRFGQYAGETFTVANVRDEGEGMHTVQTLIARPNGQNARLDWLMRDDGDSYKILDLKIEGISMSETHRSEFASVIQNSGGKVAGLIDALRKKAAQLGTG
ncbi:MAG TPA: ABC transporter substrate-binding protein [Hypericibacter adhaerens]|jgi:phospholipid transport system substrate-binding protein|uniref:Toluene tolerance protein n=1 Tax=Hypericibacter adhaerens TaxID=2602016 RepID=A0A5J6MVQ8_9PROT|nr:ABC transporter substrate-binding protein [Hypericibacter adhaerens]QEX21197.1 toluene tolerance protein [Hypericibacter adhaerens]HWA43430.1 ABC transporter substrate-binding protein [Hypericibacter adhaerens]